MPHRQKAAAAICSTWTGCNGICMERSARRRAGHAAGAYQCRYCRRHQRYCAGANEVYLCGGGAHNRALIASLQQALPECHIGLTDALGISVDWMEAIAFAWLARQTMHNVPANLPAVTGARHPCILGAIYQA